ncbi:MAG: hypothetical protein R6V19_02905 [Armatimonadota bacterium]
MMGAVEGLLVVGIVFIVVGLPALIIGGLRAYWLWLRQKTLEGLLEERRVLMDQGITDLAPLELPELDARKWPQADNDQTRVAKRPSSAQLILGLILLALGGLAIFILLELIRHADSVSAVLTAMCAVALFVGGGLWTVYRYIRPARPPVSSEPGGDILKTGDVYGNMKAGIILLALAGALVASHAVMSQPPAGVQPSLLEPFVLLPGAVVVGAVGIALLVIHAIVMASEKYTLKEPVSKSNTPP